MLTKMFWLCPLLCLALAHASAEEEASKDLDLIQGTWTMQALEINGKEVAAQQIADTFLTIRKDEYKTKVKGKEQAGLRIKLDPSKTPRAIDMIQTEADGTQKVYKGIYTVEKDVFKMCRGVAADQERPNQLATWPNTNYFVVTWKKK